MARQRLRPWLEATLDSNRIPGVSWLNKDQKIFVIPWKHGSKQDWTEEDSKIFLEWAIHTGKYRPGIDPPNYAACKTRLRCALNKAPDILELKNRDFYVEWPTQCKVYQFSDMSAEALRQQSPQDDAWSQGDNMEDDMEFETIPMPGVPTVVHHLSDSKIAYPYVVAPHFPMQQEPGGLSSDLEKVPSGDLLRPENMILTPSDLEGNPPSLNSLSLGGSTQAQGVSQPMMMDVPENHRLRSEASVFPAASVTIKSEEKENTQPLILDSPMLHLTIQDPAMPAGELSPMVAVHAMRVQIYYRSSLVIHFDVLKPEGFRMYYGSNTEQPFAPEVLEETFGPSYLTQIHCPPPRDIMQSQQQEKYTMQILDSFGRGVYFQSDAHGDVYARRLCKPSVFFKSATVTDRVEKLERKTEDMKKVFDFRGIFWNQLKRYNETKHPADKPVVDFFVSVGQRPQESDNWENLLVWARVTHLCALRLVEEASGDVDHSIHISGSNVFDQIASVIKAAPEENQAGKSEQTA